MCKCKRCGRLFFRLVRKVGCATAGDRKRIEALVHNVRVEIQHDELAARVVPEEKLKTMTRRQLNQAYKTYINAK